MKTYRVDNAEVPSFDGTVMAIVERFPEDSGADRRFGIRNSGGFIYRSVSTGSSAETEAFVLAMLELDFLKRCTTGCMCAMGSTGSFADADHDCLPVVPLPFCRSVSAGSGARNATPFSAPQHRHACREDGIPPRTR
jgi:hypothetical protein